MFSRGVIIIWVCCVLTLSTIGVGVFALQQSIKVAALTTELASSTLDLAATRAANKAKLSEQKANHELELKKQKAKIKAKERLRRSIAAVPIIGAGMIVYFEEQDYRDWIQDNPHGNPSDYACEVANNSALVIDEIVAETIGVSQTLPKSVRPNPEKVKAWLEVPKCP